MTVSQSLALFALLALPASLHWRQTLSPRALAFEAGRKHRTRDQQVPVHNPNLCEDCIGDAMPEEGFISSNTGVCGECGTFTDVWDLEHLADLKAQGIVFDERFGREYYASVLRCSHSPS